MAGPRTSHSNNGNPVSSARPPCTHVAYKLAAGNQTTKQAKPSQVKPTKRPTNQPTNHSVCARGRSNERTSRQAGSQPMDSKAKQSKKSQHKHNTTTTATREQWKTNGAPTQNKRRKDHNNGNNNQPIDLWRMNRPLRWHDFLRTFESECVHKKHI